MEKSLKFFHHLYNELKAELSQDLIVCLVTILAIYLSAMQVRKMFIDF